MRTGKKPPKPRPTKQQSTEERLRFHLEHSPLGIVEWDSKFIVKRWTGEAEHIFGWSAAETVGKPIADLHLVYEEDIPKVQETMAKLSAPGARHVISNNRNVTKDGRILYCTWHNSVLLDARGKMTSVMSKVVDNTQQKLMEQALRESENRHKLLAETMLQGVVHQNSDGTIISMNPAAERILGKTQQDFIGSTSIREEHDTIREDGSRFPGEEHPAMLALRTGEPIRNVVMGVFNPKEGIYRWISIDAVPIAQPGATTPHEVYTVFSDITDRKKAAEKLKHSEEQFRTLANAIPQLAWIAREDGYIYWYNQRWYEYTGTTPAEMEGWGWKSVHDPEVLPNVLEQWQSSLRSGKPFEMAFPLKGADGQFRVFLTRSVPLHDEHGKVERWFGTNTDISVLKRTEEALRESEERYHNLFNSIDAGFCIIQMIFDSNHRPIDYRFLEVNAAFERQTGLHNAQGKLMRDLAPNHEEHWFQVYGKIALTGEPIRFVNEASALNRWYDVYAYRIDEPELRHVAIVFNDISEHKRLENELRAAVELREEFLSIASHELKTPLTALHLQLQLMGRLANKQQIDVNALGAMSSKAFQASQQLVALLDELLDITRIRVGKLRLDKQDVDLKAAVVEGVSSVSEEAKLKGSRITVNGDQPVVGRWDPARISQIIANLLSNALKYGEGKPIEVTVIADHKSQCARLLVRDYGMGISREMQEKIFERFERAVSGTKITGLGLGLYIVRQIIEAHGGSIRVESEPGKGALFVVELPLKGDE